MIYATGIISKQSQNKLEQIVIIAIVLSAAIIGVKSFPIPTWLNTTIIALDWGLSLFFISELALRIHRTKKKTSFFKDAWNVFDTIIITISIIPIENSDLVIVARLLRVFRVMRLVSQVPELRRLTNALFNTLPKLSYILLMMFVIFYMYAAIGTTLFAKINSQLWGDILISMLTLFRVMTFEDWTDVMYEIMEVHQWSWLYFLSFIFLTAFAFLNMIIGVVVTELETEDNIKHAERNQNEPTMKDIHLELKALRLEISKGKNDCLKINKND